MKKKEFRFPFDGWHISLRYEADNIDHAIKKFRKNYKGEYDYSRIEELN
jgi:hypothetical protein